MVAVSQTQGNVVMNTLQISAKKAKGSTAPVKVDVEKIAVVQAIKDYIVTNMTDEEGNALVEEDIAANDHYIWLWYKQTKDARKDLSGSALIAEVANQLDISGEETGVAIPVMVDKDAPQWVIDASADINKDAEVSAMTVQYIDSLEFTAHAAGNIFHKLHSDKLDFSSWAVPGTRSVGDNTKDMAYCDAGKSYTLRGKTYVNKSNRRIAMDTYRNDKGEVRSSYVQLASRVGKGIEISRDRDDYAAGMITKTQKVPSGKYTVAPNEINPTDCANNYAKLSSLLTKFATALRQ